MKKFYPEQFMPSLVDRIEVGGLFLQGDYFCDYCGEEYAQRDRFQILVPDNLQEHLIGKGSFCTPECCAAYNNYLSKNTNSDECKNRHSVLEQRHGRKIFCAPPPRFLFKYDKRDGLMRSQWLRGCRDQLHKEDAETARKELYIQKKDILAI
jgi:hypothetical protein